MQKLLALLLFVFFSTVQAFIPERDLAPVTHQATLNLVASGATAAASSGTLDFYATGKAEKTTTEQQSTNTEQQYQGSNFNVGGNASFDAGNLMNIVGSGIAVDGGLAMNAEHINITAGVEENTHHSSSQTKTAGVTASTGASGSVGANASQSKNEADSYSKTHVNSQISAGNINSDSKSFTLAGANVEITNDINLNTQHLTVESVQDTHHSSSKGSSYSVGVSVSGSGGDLSGASGSAGFGKNSSNEDSQWVNNTTTLIGGGKVNITADKTTVTGGIIANATRNNDGSLTDHGNMNLVTDELIINDLQDYNRNDSKGIDLSAGLSKSGTSSVGLQKGGHNTEQTTFATLGGGTVAKKSGEQHDLANVNRDLNNTQEITKDQQTAGLDATVTVDHRLLTKKGQGQIKEDFTKTGMIVDTVALIATTDRVGITDFFKETGKKHTTYEGIKSEIANNPDLAKQLQNPDLTPDQKEAMLDQLTHRVMVDLGYSKEGYQNIIVANDKDYVQKEDGIYQRQGFYSKETQNAYINDAFINDTKGLVTTAGHELSHAMDDRSDNTYSQKDNEAYANQFGNNFGNYTNTALGVTGNGSMANSNSHVGNNSSTVQTQTTAYNALDKNKGDDLLHFIPPLIAAGAMIISDIKVANAPSPDDNLDTAAQSVSLLPTDLAAEALKDATGNQYDTAIDIAAMIGNPTHLIKDGADAVKAVNGTLGKKGGADIKQIKSGVPDEHFVLNPNIDEKYARPRNAGPTKAQKESVQGKPCVDCGDITPKQIADHKDPLVVQYYRDGKVNIEQQRQIESVQPHCPTCSNVQGGQLGQFGKKMKKELEKNNE